MDIKSLPSVSSNHSHSTIVFSNTLGSGSSDEESSPNSTTSNENPSCDWSENQSTIVLRPIMIPDIAKEVATDDDHLLSIKSNETPGCDRSDNQSTFVLSPSMLFGTNNDASYDERLRSDTYNTSPDCHGSDNQSTILFSLSMIRGTDEDASTDNDTSGNESQMLVKDNETSFFDTSENQSAILFSNSVIVGTDNGARDDKRLQSNTSNERLVSISNQSTRLFSDSPLFVNDNESLSSITSNESLASISNQSTELFCDINNDDNFIMLPKESSASYPNAMNATRVIIDQDIGSIDGRKDESLSIDVMKMDGNTFVVGKPQDETFLCTDDMKNGSHFKDTRKMTDETFSMGKGQNMTLLFTGAMEKDSLFNDRKKMVDETFLVAEVQNMMLRDGEAVCNEEMNRLGETFIVSGVQNKTFQISKCVDNMNRDRFINGSGKDVKAKRNAKENGSNTWVINKHSKNVKKEKEDQRREEVKPMRCLGSARNRQKITEVAATSSYVQEDNGDGREMEKVKMKESAQHVETRGARSKERVRAIQTKSPTDDEVEPLVQVSRVRKCKAKAIAAISAMLN